ncbi:hypothetical protein GCM10020295_41710 [Streptomyces cinereospinus]
MPSSRSAPSDWRPCWCPRWGGGDQGTTTQERRPADTFARGRLEQQVADLLAVRERPGSSSRAPRELGEGSAPGSDGPRILTQPTAPVPECVQKGIGRDDDALATEPGTYQGTTALLVVMPDASDLSRVTAYVVDATCVKGAPSASAEVLLQQSYPQP